MPSRNCTSRLAPLASGALSVITPADNVRAVLDHLPGVERALLARDALHDEPRVPVNENAQGFAPLNSCQRSAVSRQLLTCGGVIPFPSHSMQETE